MRGEIFDNAETGSDRRFALQNGKMLKVHLGPQTGSEVLARKGAMVAYQGAVDFDAQMQSWGQRLGRMFTGEGAPLMRCSGQGDVFFANLAADVHIVELENDGLTVNGTNLLAMDAGLHWEIQMVQSAAGMASQGLFNMVITGTGSVAITTHGHPVMLRVTPSTYTFADGDAVVAWTTGLRTSIQSNVTMRSVFSVRGQTGEAWQMQFQGDGFVVVQPDEGPPPTPAGQA